MDGQQLEFGFGNRFVSSVADSIRTRLRNLERVHPYLRISESYEALREGIEAEFKSPSDATGENLKRIYTRLLDFFKTEAAELFSQFLSFTAKKDGEDPVLNVFAHLPRSFALLEKQIRGDVEADYLREGRESAAAAVVLGLTTLNRVVNEVREEVREMAFDALGARASRALQKLHHEQKVLQLFAMTSNQLEDIMDPVSDVVIAGIILEARNRILEDHEEYSLDSLGQPIDEDKIKERISERAQKVLLSDQDIESRVVPMGPFRMVRAATRAETDRVLLMSGRTPLPKDSEPLLGFPDPDGDFAAIEVAILQQMIGAGRYPPHGRNLEV